MESSKIPEILYSKEAERAVLGSIMLDTTAYEGQRAWDVCQDRGVTPETFFDPSNRFIYSTMQELNREARTLDSITIMETLRAKGRLEAIGGATYLESLYDGTPTSAHIEYYVRVVKDKQQRRQMFVCANKIAERVLEEQSDTNASSLLGQAIKSFQDIDVLKKDIRSWQDVTKESFKRIDRKLSNPTVQMDGLPTGLRRLDDTLQGLKKSEMIVIGARPSVGKTSLAMNIAEHVAREKHPVLIFSLEMPVEKLNERMIIAYAEMDTWRLNNAMYAKPPKNEAEKEEHALIRDNLYTAIANIQNLPIHVDDSQGLDIMDIRARARWHKKTNAIELVVIDYLTLCRYREVGVKLGLYQEVSMISQQIKNMARELDVPVIVLSQLNRNASNRGGDSESIEDGYEVPKMSDLRESGSIEQDADVVILMNKTSGKLRDGEVGYGRENTGVVVECLNVAKNRNGQTGKVEVLFERPHTRFLDRVPERKSL